MHKHIPTAEQTKRETAGENRERNRNLSILLDKKKVKKQRQRSKDQTHNPLQRWDDGSIEQDEGTEEQDAKTTYTVQGEGEAANRGNQKQD